MAIEFVIVVAEAVGTVIQQNSQPRPSQSQQLNNYAFAAPVPFVGFLPLSML